MASNTTTYPYPYDTVVYITDTIGGQGWQGSGVLISPDEVLTASHVVYIQGDQPASNISVTPAYDDGLSPYGSATSENIHYFNVQDPTHSLTGQQSQYDYALIHLATPFPNAGTMGIESNFGGGEVSITGYPASAGGAQVDSTQTVYQDPNYTLLDGTSLGEGSSGGPVWIETAKGPEVVGLVSTATGANGYNVQITTTVFNQIEAWLAEDGSSDSPPTISGTVANQAVSDRATIAPFSHVTIADSNTGQTETVSVQLSATADGTLSNLGGGTYNAQIGEYTATGSASAVTSALDGLVFTPTAHQVAVGGTVITTFTVRDTDTAGQSASNTTTSVIATAVGIPTITNLLASQAITDKATIAPFSKVIIADSDPVPTESLSVTLSNAANGTLSNLGGGAYDATKGVYTVKGTPAIVTAALEGLVFTPTAHQVAAGQTITTTFSIVDTDAATGTASATSNVVVTATAVPSATVSSVAAQPNAGDATTGGVVTLTVTMGEAVTVAGGTPSLSLNDGGAASYSGGSGTSTLTFRYTVVAGQTVKALAVTGFNSNGATIRDPAGNSANFAGVQTTFVGLDVNATGHPVVDADFTGAGVSDVLFRDNATGAEGYWAPPSRGSPPTWHDMGTSSTAYSVVGSPTFG